MHKISHFLKTKDSVPQEIWQEIFSRILNVQSKIRFARVSKCFNQIKATNQDADLKPLEAFMKTRQWSFKDERLMKLILWISRLEHATLIFENFKKASTANNSSLGLDVENLTPAEVLNQLQQRKQQDQLNRIDGLYKRVVQELFDPASCVKKEWITLFVSWIMVVMITMGPPCLINLFTIGKIEMPLSHFLIYVFLSTMLCVPPFVYELIRHTRSNVLKVQKHL